MCQSQSVRGREQRVRAFALFNLAIDSNADSRGVVRDAWVIRQACVLQDVVAVPGWRVSGDFTVHVFKKKCHLPKPLNQREFVEPGTHLAPLGDTNARMTQPRLRTLNEIDLR